MRYVLSILWEKIPQRSIEWLLSLMILSIGIVLILDEKAYDRAGMSGFLTFLPEIWWSLFAIIIGLFRMIALMVNGFIIKLTAPIRFIGSLLGVTMFSSYATAAYLSNTPMVVTVFSVLMIGDFYNSVLSGSEIINKLSEQKCEI